MFVSLCVVVMVMTINSAKMAEQHRMLFGDGRTRKGPMNHVLIGGSYGWWCCGLSLPWHIAIIVSFWLMICIVCVSFCHSCTVAKCHLEAADSCWHKNRALNGGTFGRHLASTVEL